MVKKDSKEKIRKKVLLYITKKYSKENRFVSKREIRKEFQISLYNYFENIYYLYQQAGIEVPLAYCPKEYARKKIIEYVQKQNKKGRFAGIRELDKSFGIQVHTYFSSMEDLFREAGISLYEYQKSLANRSNPYNSNEANEKNIQRIINHIQKKVKDGFYPSVHFIQKALNLKFYKYFKDIYTAYRQAGVEYHRPCPIILGRKKEDILTNLTVHLFKKMGYRIQRVSIFDQAKYNSGADLTIVNPHGETILLEIKAYGKYKRVCRREITQLQRYMEEQNIAQGILLTSSIIISKIPSGITLIDGNELIKLCYTFNLANFLEDLFWVQTARVNRIEITEAKEKKRQEIIKFIGENPQITKVGEIEKILAVDLRTYLGRNRSKKIEEIRKKNKSKFNTDNVQVYMGHQLVHQDKQLVEE